MVQSVVNIKFMRENRNKIQKVNVFAIIAGNIQLTHYNDYWSIKSHFFLIGKSDSSDFALFEQIIHEGVENTECIEIMGIKKNQSSAAWIIWTKNFIVKKKIDP